MSAQEMNVQQLQDAMQEDMPILVDYWAQWCPDCRRIAAAYDKIAQQREGQLRVVKMNMDEEEIRAFAKEQGVQRIPTLTLYRGTRAVASIAEPESKAAMDAFIEEALAK